MLLPALGWLPWLVANGGEIIRTRRLLRLLREAGGLPREGNSQHLLLCIILVGEGLEKVDLEGEDLVVGVDLEEEDLVVGVDLEEEDLVVGVDLEGEDLEVGEKEVERSHREIMTVLVFRTAKQQLLQE